MSGCLESNSLYLCVFFVFSLALLTCRENNTEKQRRVFFASLALSGPLWGFFFEARRVSARVCERETLFGSSLFLFVCLLWSFAPPVKLRSLSARSDSDCQQKGER